MTQRVWDGGCALRKMPRSLFFPHSQITIEADNPRRRYRSLKSEEEIVYSLIDEAGDDGVWARTIKSKANLHDAVFNAAIKHLESKNMISNMKSVEHPARKMYIKSSVRPSDRATGGPWYTDGELD